MLTDALLEEWQMDRDLIASQAIDELGECDVYLGGSLCDDLGELTSDIDLYCFSRDLPTSVRSWSSANAVPTVHAHTIHVGDETERLVNLTPLVVSMDPVALSDLPIMTGEIFRSMHALFCNQRLARGLGAGEDFRSRTGADALPVYVALRAVHTAQQAIDHVTRRGGRAVEPSFEAIYRVRVGVEAALDAAVASRGLVNPNPRFRIALAQRAGLLSLGSATRSDVLSALFPDFRRGAAQIEEAAQCARELLEIVYEDAFLSAKIGSNTAVAGNGELR
jgi:hypothetical protein